MIISARINQETLQVGVTGGSTPVVKPVDTNSRGGFGMSMEREAPSYLLTGDTLVLMRNTEILSLSISTGKVLQRSALPKELQPAPAGRFLRGEDLISATASIAMRVCSGGSTDGDTRRSTTCSE